MATSASGGGMPAVGTIGTPTMWITALLAVSVVAGLIGGIAFESGDDMQAILFSLTAIAGSLAGFLLAVRHIRRNLDLSGAGFGVLGALAVAGVVAGFTGPGADSVFGSLAILHWGALWTIAAQNWSPIWARAAAALSGLLFALYGYDYVLGDQLEPPDPESPLALIAWAAFTVAVIGWIMTLSAEGDDATAPPSTLGP
ncbi:MAG: hypothetical protein M3271_09775 [Actinomycetota bacterium]|nr:hypothetical protein [Actinomycetota bacterium]